MTGIGHSVQYVGSAAYDSGLLHPRVSGNGRFTYEPRPYIWRGISDFGLGVMDTGVRAQGAMVD
jgi:hypothetical protein